MNLSVLNSSRHADLRLKQSTDFTFASERKMVPVWGREIPKAAQHFPIVFVPKGERWMPVALMTVGERNLFVSKEGGWLADYVPAVLRAHPFYSVDSGEGQAVVGIVEDDPDFIAEGSESAEDAVPLFDKDGQPSQLTKKALRILEQIRTEQERTWVLMDALDDLEVLTSWSPGGVGGSEAPVSQKLFAVSEERLTGLADEAFLKLRTSGLLAMVYAHLMSLPKVKDLRPTQTLRAENRLHTGRPGTGDDSLLFSREESVFSFDDE